MGGFCGVISEQDCGSDLFFGTDYHSHLGTHRGGVAVLGPKGFQRSIHNIQNSPFRSKFEHDVARFEGPVGIGVISDTDPQPLIMSSKLGTFGIVTVGLITNQKELMTELFTKNSAQLQYSTNSGMVGPTEVVSALIATQPSIVEGVKYVQEKVKGSVSILLMTEDGRLYAARDKYGRTPVAIGRKEGATIALMESCALPNLGYDHLRDLGPGEMVEMEPDGVTTVIEPGKKMAICAFMWVYYGYPASSYEGRNVEMARYRCGSALAKRRRRGVRHSRQRHLPCARLRAREDDQVLPSVREVHPDLGAFVHAERTEAARARRVDEAHSDSRSHQGPPARLLR